MPDVEGERIGTDPNGAVASEDVFVGAFPDSDKLAPAVAQKDEDLAGGFSATGSTPPPGEYQGQGSEVVLIITDEPQVQPEAEYYPDPSPSIPVPGGNVALPNGAVVDTENQTVIAPPTMVEPEDQASLPDDLQVEGAVVEPEDQASLPDDLQVEGAVVEPEGQGSVDQPPVGDPQLPPDAVVPTDGPPHTSTPPQDVPAPTEAPQGPTA
jgi:hypothetical protein